MSFLVLLFVCSCVAASNKFNGVVFLAAAGQSCANLQSLQELASSISQRAASDACGAQTQPTVSFVVSYFQRDINSTTIGAIDDETLSFDDVKSVVAQAKALGFKVVLKPHVELSHPQGNWRGQIGTFFNATQWDEWFASYTSYLTTMATWSQTLQFDMLNIGTELTATQQQTQHWRSVIQAVRAVYGGRLTYGCNHGDCRSIQWWDALDLIGIDAYYPLSKKTYPAREELVAGWKSVVATSFLPLVQKYPGKGIAFMEVGYGSLNDAAITPWAPAGNLSLSVQENCYGALYDALWDYDWFQGVLFWAWTYNVQDGGPFNGGFSPRNKPALQQLSWCGKVPK